MRETIGISPVTLSFRGWTGAPSLSGYSTLEVAPSSEGILVRLRSDYLEAHGDDPTARQRLAHGHIDLAEIRRVVALEWALGKAVKRVADAERQLADAQLAWDNSGFEEAVDAAMATWRSKHPSPGGMHGIGVNAQSAALHGFIRSYVAQHRALPSGSHQLVARYESSSWTFQVNFEEFVGIEGW
jgi:hypothetical protein